MPFREESIAGQPDLFIARVVDTIEILLVLGHDRSELLEIEESVSRFYRLECPLDRPHAQLERSCPLRPFQSGTDAETLKRSANRRHVGIERLLSPQKCRNAQ